MEKKKDTNLIKTASQYDSEVGGVVKRLVVASDDENEIVREAAAGGIAL